MHNAGQAFVRCAHRRQRHTGHWRFPKARRRLARHGSGRCRRFPGARWCPRPTRAFEFRHPSGKQPTEAASASSSAAASPIAAATAATAAAAHCEQCHVPRIGTTANVQLCVKTGGQQRRGPQTRLVSASAAGRTPRAPRARAAGCADGEALGQCRIGAQPRSLPHLCRRPQDQTCPWSRFYLVSCSSTPGSAPAAPRDPAQPEDRGAGHRTAGPVPPTTLHSTVQHRKAKG